MFVLGYGIVQYCVALRNYFHIVTPSKSSIQQTQHRSGHPPVTSNMAHNVHRWLSQDICTPFPLCQRKAMKGGIRLYYVTILQELQPPGMQKRVAY
jgi:hypothetical protein